MTVLPRWRSITQYESKLTNRFSAHAFDVKEAATKAATEAHKIADDLAPTANDAALDAHQKKAISDLVTLLRTSANAAQQVAAKWDTQRIPAENACSLVERALDLQVSKAGGILAFNGLATAVALLLWTSFKLEQFRLLPHLVFWCLLASSILSLGAILSWWSPPAKYATPEANLTSSLKLAVVRAWAANVAVILASLATIAISMWAWNARKDTPNVKVEWPVTAPSWRLTLPDSLRLKCQEAEIQRGRQNVDDITCTLFR